jgi:hypothetical protein
MASSKGIFLRRASIITITITTAICNLILIRCGAQRARPIPDRLLQNVEPLEYELTLRFDSADRRGGLAGGAVQMYVRFLNATRGACSAASSACLAPDRDQEELMKTITFNVGSGVQIKNTSLVWADSVGHLKQNRATKPMQIENIHWNRKKGVIALRLATDLPAGAFGKILIEFSQTDNEIRGLSSSKHGGGQNGDDGPPPPTILTQVSARFERNLAHHVFPCFDAPRFRTPFTLTIFANKSLAVHSNTPIANRNVDGGGLAKTTFERTPPIPVHKLVFSVGDYEEPILLNRTVNSVTRVSFSVPNTPNRSLTSHHYHYLFALQIACDTLVWLARELGQQLPIRKLDIIPTETGQSSAPIESLGAILIERDFITFDNDESSPERKILVALNVARSVAHQWFGNVVSPRRWIDNWILDGIATHLAIEALEQLMPGLGARHYFHLYLLQQAKSLKANLAAARESNILVTTTISTQLNENLSIDLDTIKSASILSMLQSLIGQNELNESIKKLLNFNQNGLITQNDFTEILSTLTNGRISQTQLETYFSSWTEHASFPLISVLLSPTGDETPTVHIYQTHIEDVKMLDLQKYKYKLSSAQNAVLLPIKLLFANSDGSKRHIVKLPLDVFRKRSTPTNPMANLVKVALPEWFDSARPESGHWLKIVSEPGVLPFYCVRYNEEIIDRMRPPIQDNLMSHSDKIGLLTGAVVLARMGSNVVQAELASKLVSWLEMAGTDSGTATKDTELIVAELQAKDSYLAATSDHRRPPLVSLGRSKRLFDTGRFSTLTNESNFEKFARSVALTDLVMDDDRQVIDAALEAFDSNDHDHHRIAAFLRPPIYAAVTRAGSSEQKTRLLARLQEARWPEERARLKFAQEHAGVTGTPKNLDVCLRWFWRWCWQGKN